jgi:hypothetical protein
MVGRDSRIGAATTASAMVAWLPIPNGPNRLAIASPPPSSNWAVA